MRSLSHIAPALLCVLASGCVLVDSADDYPYRGPLVIIEFDTGGEPPDDPPDMAEDIPPPPPPELIFTEVLIDSSETRAGFGDLGEYIEIKNVGSGVAIPQQIVILLSDPDDPGGQRTQKIQVALPALGNPAEQEAYESLRPIQPGDYFTFVRFETEQVPISQIVPEGASYDFGAFANGPTLPDSGSRQLELTYFDARTPEPFDVLIWRNGRLVAPDGPMINPDQALGLDGESESVEGNDDPKNWCVPTETLDGSDVPGTPGGPTDCP